MRTYIAYIKINLLLTMRDRLILFFNYAFPLVFFFMFGQFMGASQGGVATQVVAMVLIIGVLGNGFFGAGIRAVQDRELNILRRFKVAPITPTPLLTASLVTGWVAYIPMAVTVVVLAHFLYRMPLPSNWFSFFIFLSLGILALRAVGLVIAAVVNSAQEGQIVIQLLYFPMLFLSGATFPLNMMPVWVQSVAQFLPASHLFLGIQGILVRGESLAEVWTAALALLVTLVLSMFVAGKLFRWEKEEKISFASKAWLVAVLLPFVALGAWQAYSQENLVKVRVLAREMRRGRAYLIRDARIFTGDGKLIEPGAVLIRGGKIERVFEGKAPQPKDLRAELVEASGKTLLPGLIDAAVALDQPGGIYSNPAEYQRDRTLRELAAYLYCGVTAVRSGADAQRSVPKARDRILSGEFLGAEVVTRTAGGPAAYISLLSQHEAARDLAQGRADLLNLSLVQQVGPAALLEATAKMLRAPETPRGDGPSLDDAMENLRRAWKSGAMLVAGTGSGAMLLVHGPAIHRELQLWVQAGIPAAVALQAATSNGAKFAGAADRFGTIRPGLEANLLLVDGNPLADVSATERISDVFFRGEYVHRSDLFDQR